jgi:hypothetical protein
MATKFQTSYLTVAEADAILLTRSELWASTSNAKKGIALVQATASLDTLLWLGQAVSSTQPLSWPRKTFVTFEPRLNQPVTVEEGTIPQQLALATANLAVHFLSNPSLLEGQETKSFESISLGPLSISDSDSDRSRPTPAIPYNTVLKLLDPFITSRSSGNTWWRAN